ALADVSPSITEHNSDFELYRRLRKGGRSSLHPSQLAGPPDEIPNMSGKSENPGWKLDKWKFLPMINRTLQMRPDKQWYVFVEADTCVLWSMLLRYLESFDPTKPIYAGNPKLVGEVMFAHGGSGFVVSRPALESVVEHYATRKKEIESFTNEHWAGDCVLGKVLLYLGVSVTNVWPVFQRDYPGFLSYTPADRRPVASKSPREWCGLTVSYHHMAPSEIEELWHLEQDWLINQNPGKKVLRHIDIFTKFAMPRMKSVKGNWDNLSEDRSMIASSIDECRHKCMADPECMQYSCDKDKLCKTHVHLRLGRAKPGVTSGWIRDRVVDFAQGMASCEGASWPT
ncbi:hypothetical protein WHR41_09502, partial [Cladosporium halotolerans]